MSWPLSPFSFSNSVVLYLLHDGIDKVTSTSPPLVSFNRCICPVLHTVHLHYTLTFDESVIIAMCGPNHPSLKKVILQSGVGSVV